MYTSTKLWSTVESSDPFSLLQLLNECSVKLVYLGDLEFGTLRPKGPPPMSTLPLPSSDEASTSKLDVEQSSHVETTGDSANVETDASEAETPEQASYVETHSSEEELSGHVETSLDSITVKQELADVSTPMLSDDDEPPMLMPSEYVILKNLKVTLTPLSERDIQEWIKPTPLLENTSNKYSLRDRPSRSKVSGIILRNRKSVDYKPILDSAIKSKLPEFRRRKEKPRPCVSGPSSCRIRANALIRQAKRKQFQTKPVINKFPDQPSPPVTNEGVTDDTTKTLPTSDRPVEMASNHSELAYNVETDGSLTEDYDVPDQVFSTDSVDRSKNEKEQSYTVSIKSYVLKKKNKKLRKVRCKICNASCKGVKSLNKHHRSEHDIQFCSDCGKGFATQTALDKHSYVHGELNLVCETCGKAFPFDSRLQQHKLIHYCMRNGCKKYFKSIGDLNRHVFTHNKSIYYYCDYCTYKNLDKRNTESHMRIHVVGNERYVCNSCEKPFRFNTQYRHHLRDGCNLHDLKGVTRSASPDF